MRSARALAVVLALLPVFACDCSTEPSEPELVTLEEFRIESVEPAPDTSGGALRVSQGATVRFAYRITGPVGRLVLAANDEVLAELDAAEGAGTYVDDCADSVCGTDVAGPVDYTLTAIGSGEDATSDTRTLSIVVGGAASGLAIRAFSADPLSLDAGGDVTLAWDTTGAVSGTLRARPAAGGESRVVAELPAFDPAEPTANSVRSGTVVDAALSASTVYELEVRDAAGATASASRTVSIRGSAAIVTFSAADAVVAPGGATTLSWTTTGLAGLELRRDDGRAAVVVPAAEIEAGAREVTVDLPTRFTLVGLGFDGATVTELCDPGCRPATVDVGVIGAPTAALTALDEEIPHGGTGELEWTSTGASSLLLRWTDVDGAHELELALAETGTVPLTPLDTVEYELVATGPTGVEATARATIGVRPVATVTAPAEGPAGQPVTVAFTTAGAVAVTVEVDGLPADVTGLAVAGDSLDVTIPAGAAPGSELVIVVRATDDETPARTSDPAEARVLVR